VRLVHRCAELVQQPRTKRADRRRNQPLRTCNPWATRVTANVVCRVRCAVRTTLSAWNCATRTNRASSHASRNSSSAATDACTSQACLGCQGRTAPHNMAPSPPNYPEIQLRCMFQSCGVPRGRQSGRYATQSRTARHAQSAFAAKQRRTLNAAARCGWLEPNLPLYAATACLAEAEMLLYLQCNACVQHRRPVQARVLCG
jgi:hypothetical protein